MLQHWGTADVSNFSTPGTLTSRAVTPEQPKGDSGGEPAVLPPGHCPVFAGQQPWDQDMHYSLLTGKCRWQIAGAWPQLGHSWCPRGFRAVGAHEEAM